MCKLTWHDGEHYILWEIRAQRQSARDWTCCRGAGTARAFGPKDWLRRLVHGLPLWRRAEGRTKDHGISVAAPLHPASLTVIATSPLWWDISAVEGGASCLVAQSAISAET